MTSENPRFRVGDHVRHETYGLGTITALDSDPERTTYAMVSFVGMGVGKVFTPEQIARMRVASAEQRSVEGRVMTVKLGTLHGTMMFGGIFARQARAAAEADVLWLRAVETMGEDVAAECRELARTIASSDAFEDCVRAGGITGLARQLGRKLDLASR